MPKVQQLTVTCENRPGTLAHLAKTLGDAKVNIVALHTETSGTEGRVRLIVDNVNKARKALGNAGLSFSEEPVLHVELPDVSGALGAFAGKLAAKDINITAAYATAGKKAKKANMVLAVSDLDKAARIR